MTWTLRLAVIAGFLLYPSLVRAQSATTAAIAGVVRDATGAVLPGVTVEAASPALIEKVRTVVADGDGQYKIIELRPGTYTVTFTLTGFNIVRREGVELTTGFTATVNADLQVGSLEETITVSGIAPVVDAQNVRTQNVLSREALDVLPTNKTIQGFATLTVGATTTSAGGGGSNHDVGGNKMDQYGAVAYHGNDVQDGRMLYDGMSFNMTGVANGGPSKHYYVNQADVQEVVLEVAGMTAESETSGVAINMVPKSGGNRFSGYFATTGNNSKMQQDNLTDELRSRGLTAVSELKKTYDIGGGFGGPFKRDRLWFYTAHRWWGSQETAAGNFYNLTQGTPIFTPDPSRPGFTDYYNRDNSVRLTWQAAAKHKITGSYSKQRNCNCHLFVDVGNRSPEASVDYEYYDVSLTQGTWTFPATNRLLFQAGGTWLRNIIDPRPQPEVTPTDVPIIEQSRNFNYNAPAVGLIGGAGTGTDNDYSQHNERFSVSYVTGSHAMKAGVFTLSGRQDFGYVYVNQDIYYLLTNSRPSFITQWASPTASKNNLRLNLGIYAQDQWTISRATLNLGIRYDYFNGAVPEQTRPGGQFVEAVHFDRVDDVPDFRDISPRLGVAYDLLGDGRTALKVSVGRYVQSLGARITDLINPVNSIVQSTNRVWNDANADYVPDCDLRNFDANGECGGIDNRAFGTSVVNQRYADDVLQGWGNRGYNWQTTAGVQHQLWRNTAVNVGYFYSHFANFTVTDNLSATPADFDPYCITAPVDERLPGGGGYQVCDLADISPARFGQVNNLVTQASHFGKQNRTYHGVDGSFSARFGQGGLFSGGFSTGRTANQCAVVDGPIQFCENVPPFLTQVKLNGSYPLPWWDIHASATYQNLPGAAIDITYVPSNAEIAPSLGRDLAACRGVSPCTASGPAVRLAEPTTVFEDRLSQLDLRLAKIFGVGRTRVQGMFDIYNIFNASTVLGSTGRYGPAYLRPASVMGGRTFKFAAQMDF